MSPMSRHILQHGDTHGELLAIRQTFVSLRIRVELLLVYSGNLVRVHWQKLILFIPMTNKLSTPPPINLFKEKAEAAISFGVNLAAVDGESLGDGCLHFGHCTSSIGCDICCHSMAAVHNESTFVHTRFRGRHEILVVNAAGPGSIHMGIFVENRFEILPFT